MKTTKKEIAENTTVTRTGFATYRYNYNHKENRYDGDNTERRVYDGMGACVGVIENGKKDFVSVVHEDLVKY